MVAQVHGSDTASFPSRVDTRCMAAPWLALSFLLALAPVDWQAMREEARRNEIQPDTARVAAAARSPETLWAFLVDPDTFYDDRMAAAAKANSVLPPRYIGKQSAAQAELRYEAWKHRWWQRSPDAPQPAIARVTLLGVEWQPPAEPLLPPRNLAEERKMPWPWQVDRALRQIYLPVRSESGFEAVQDLPCANGRDQEAIIRALQRFPRTAETYGVLRNIFEKNGGKTRILPWLADTSYDWWATQAFVAELAPAADYDMISVLAPVVGNMRAGAPIDTRASFPFTALLALASRIDDLALDPQNSEYLLSGKAALLQAVDVPKFEAEHEPHEWMLGFHRWLETNRPALEAGAAAEADAVAAARERLHQVALCR